MTEPSGGTLEDAGRGAVQPVDVVDGHNHRGRRRQLREDGEEPRGDGPRVGTQVLGLRTKESHLECLALRHGNRREDCVCHLGQEVGEAREGELGLMLDGAGPKDVPGTMLGRLADAVSR